MAKHAPRLYKISDTANPGKPYTIPETFFSEKEKAKARRKDLNGQPEVAPLRYIVSPGPDHRNYRG